MKYIKVRFVLPHPLSEDYDSYGWETAWTKKAQIIGGDAIEPGQIVNFQPVTVQRDGKFLVLATERNLKAIRGMIAKKQMALAPGETLEPAPIVAAVKPEVDVWPDEPGAKPVDEEAEPELVEVAVKPSKKAQVFKPDVE